MSRDEFIQMYVKMGWRFERGTNRLRKGDRSVDVPPESAFPGQAEKKSGKSDADPDHSSGSRRRELFDEDESPGGGPIDLPSTPADVPPGPSVSLDVVRAYLEERGWAEVARLGPIYVWSRGADPIVFSDKVGIVCPEMWARIRFVADQ